MNDRPYLNIHQGELQEDPVLELLGRVCSQLKSKSPPPWENWSLGNITVSTRNDIKATRERTPTAPKAAFIQY